MINKKVIKYKNIYYKFPITGVLILSIFFKMFFNKNSNKTNQSVKSSQTTKKDRLLRFLLRNQQEIRSSLVLLSLLSREEGYNLRLDWLQWTVELQNVLLVKFIFLLFIIIIK